MSGSTCVHVHARSNNLAYRRLLLAMYAVEYVHATIPRAREPESIFALADMLLLASNMRGTATAHIRGWVCSVNGS